MTAINTNISFSSPLSDLWLAFERWFQIVGYSRAAAELARHGQLEAAKMCMMEVKRVRNGR